MKKTHKIKTKSHDIQIGPTITPDVKSITFKPDVQEKVVEVVKEVIRTVTVEIEKPQLEGYELYAKLRDVGFYQGGVGQTMENPSGVDKVYVPEVAELYQSFALDPIGWEKVRDALCRVWIEMHQDGN